MLKVINEISLAAFPAALLCSAKIAAASPAAAFAFIEEKLSDPSVRRTGIKTLTEPVTAGDLVVMVNGKEAVLIGTDPETSQEIEAWLDCFLDSP